MNIAGFLRETAKAFPKKTAYIYAGREYTYAELHDLVSRAAASLRAMGVKKGDRVAVYHYSSIDFIILYYAVVRLGAVVVPINIMLKEREVDWILSNSGASFVFYSQQQERAARAAAVDAGGVSTLMPIGGDAYKALFSSAGMDDYEECDRDDVATIIYTSGTTGKPKGAMITHANFDSNTADVIEVLKYDESMVRVSVTPLFHTMGLTVIILANTRVAGTAVVQPRLEMKEFLAANEHYRATMVSGAPALHYLLVNAPETAGFDLASWGYGFSGSAPLSEGLQAAFEKKFGLPLYNGYGLTESTAAVSITRTDRPLKRGSIGTPLPSNKVRVLDDSGRDAGPLGRGEISVNGPNVMKGYYGNPEATSETIRDGWLLTGDVGYLDGEGDLYIVDRKKDLIICSGFNVYPREIEDVLLMHPGVADAAVVGVSDPKRGESPYAFVIKKPGVSATADELIRFSNETLAAYKHVKHVEFVDEFPRNPNRKILKRELREIAENE